MHEHKDHTNPMKRIQKSLLFTTFAAMIIIGCNSNKEPSSGPMPDAVPGNATILTLAHDAIHGSGITVVTVEMKPLRGSISIPARLLPNQDYEAQVGSLVQGRVQKVSANVGDVVSPGQELMRIEGVEVGEIKAKFITARAQLKFVEANLQRQKTLAEQHVGSQQIPARSAGRVRQSTGRLRR